MADTYDDDLGGVEGVPVPPRHKEDIIKELQKLSSALTEAIFENDLFDEYAHKFPAEFAFQVGESVCLLASPGRTARAKMIEGFDTASDGLLADIPEDE